MKTLTLFISISLFALQLTFATHLDNMLEPKNIPDMVSSTLKILNQDEFMRALDYPKKLKSLGIEGNVTLKLSVNKKGELYYYRIMSSSNEEFIATCMENLSKLKFQLAIDENGQHVRASIILPIKFELTF